MIVPGETRIIYEDQTRRLEARVMDDDGNLELTGYWRGALPSRERWLPDYDPGINLDVEALEPPAKLIGEVLEMRRKAE